MTEELLPAIQNGGPWLERFTRLGYKDAFQEYMALHAPAWRRAAAEAPDPTALAEDILDGLETGRKRARFWNRSAKAFEEKQMMVAYTAPMLLEIGLEPIACAIRDGWAARWPKDAWKIARHEKLRKSFRNTFMGIELRPRRIDDEDEED